MKLEPLKDVDWCDLITLELIEQKVNFTFPDPESQEVGVINSVINDRIESAVEWLIQKIETKNIEHPHGDNSFLILESIQRRGIINLIKKAFEDVIK